MAGYYTFSITGRVEQARIARHQQFFLVTDDGREREVRLSDDAFPVADGDRVTVVFGRREDGGESHLFYIFNHTREARGTLPGPLRHIRGPAWPMALLAALWWTLILAAAFATFWDIQGNPIDSDVEWMVFGAISGMCLAALTLVFWMVRDAAMRGIDSFLMGDAERHLAP